MFILGLDVSTSNVGICLMDTEQPQMDSVVLAYVIPMSKIKGLYAKSCEVQRHFLDVANKYKIDLIVVEEALQAFRSRMSSAGTISKLNRFNGIVSYIARTEFNCPVHQANVVSSRKAVQCILNRKSSKNTKEQVLEWVKIQPEMQKYDWPTKILKSGPNAGKIKLEAGCYDIADAFVMSLWGSKFLNIEGADPTVL